MRAGNFHVRLTASTDAIALNFAVAAHLMEQLSYMAAGAARLIEAMNAEAPKRESRFSQLSKREHLNVADAKGRRHGRTYGPARDGGSR